MTDEVTPSNSKEADALLSDLMSKDGKFNTNIEQITGGEIHIGDRIHIEPSQMIQQQKFGQPVSLPTLSPEVLREVVCRFLEDIETTFKSIRLFHTPQPLTLQAQYIPIQVTLERRYHHQIETTWSYPESEDDLKRAYALKGGDENNQGDQQDWNTVKTQCQNKHLIVLADPGMGKSTLLRQEALSTAQQARQGLENGQELGAILLPVYLRLSDLADSPEEFQESIPRLIQRDYPTTTPDMLPWLRKKLKKGAMSAIVRCS